MEPRAYLAQQWLRLYGERLTERSRIFRDALYEDDQLRRALGNIGTRSPLELYKWLKENQNQPFEIPEKTWMAAKINNNWRGKQVHPGRALTPVEKGQRFRDRKAGRLPEFETQHVQLPPGCRFRFVQAGQYWKCTFALEDVLPDKEELPQEEIAAA